jgi:hypothetical protein
MRKRRRKIMLTRLYKRVNKYLQRRRTRLGKGWRREGFQRNLDTETQRSQRKESRRIQAGKKGEDKRGDWRRARS